MTAVAESIELIQNESAAQRLQRRRVSNNAAEQRQAPRSSFGKAYVSKHIFISQIREVLLQSTPSLLAALFGSILSGLVLNRIQTWPVFEQMSELFILVPILLNLKGCLEMNLASRMSTSANIGDLDLRRTRRALVIGNLALLQVQSLTIGLLAGVLSFVLGYWVNPHRESWFESALMMVSAMITGSVSSMLLSTFMATLCILVRRVRGNPDNVATPLAASFGDLITLVVLGSSAKLLLKVFTSPLSTVILIILLMTIPVFIVVVWKNPYVREYLGEGWSAVLLSMIISSGSGLVLERFIVQYSGFALLTPVAAGLCGNVGCVYASRLSTEMHMKSDTGGKALFELLTVPITLGFISAPIPVLYILLAMSLGFIDFAILFLVLLFIATVISMAFALTVAYFSVRFCKWRNLNPDNTVLGIISATTDVVATSLLLASFAISEPTL